MQFDPLSDAFVRMYNAEQAGHYEVSLAPASKLLDNMLKIMQISGYVVNLNAYPMVVVTLSVSNLLAQSTVVV